MRVKFDLRAKFLLLITISFLIIISLIYIITTKEIRNFFIEATRIDISEHVQNHAKEYFNLDQQFSLKFSGNYIDFVNDLEGISGINNIKLIDPNGTIIYSKIKENIGGSVASNTFFQSALNGQTTLFDIEYTTKIVKFTTPIKSSNGSIRGVIEANASLSETINHTNNFILKLIVLLGSVSIFYIIFSYIIFSNASRSIEEQDRSIVDKSKALEEERELDEAIMASVAESLIVINKDGQIVLFNPEAEKITGHKADEVEYRLYKKILFFCDKDGNNIKENPIEKCLLSGKIIEIKIKDGFYIKDIKKNLSPISISVAPIITKGDSIKGVVATIQNISTEKELDRVKDEFVYIVAHELGNPVFTVDGYLSILEEQGKKFDKPTKDIIHSARSVNQQLASLVNDLLEAVRNEQGNLACEIDKININKIIKELIKSASFKAKSKNIKIHYLESKIPLVITNEQKIKEVIMNLIDNALKYTPRGGTVEVFHEISGDNVITHVKDNGFGMSQEEQGKLFEKFYRIKNDNTKNISGTGLGLFICRQIIEKCGGKIWADSEEGKGSTFSFALKKSK